MLMGWTVVIGIAMAASLAPVLVWRDRHPMPEGRSGGAAGVIGGSLVYAGGTTWRNGVKAWLDTTLFYNFEQDTWITGAPLPEPLAYGPYVAVDDSIEIFGGANGKGSSRKCWRLKAGEQTWRQSGLLPADSVLAKAVAVRGRVYLFGGSRSAADLHHLSSAVYERSETGQWKRISTMPQGAIVLPAIARSGESIYLFGGCSAAASGGALNHNSAYRFDPDAKRWTALEPVPAAVRGMSAVALDNRSILLAGGYTDTGFSAATYVYDTQDGHYRPAASLPFPAMGMEMLMRGSVVWGAGGEDKNRSRTARVIEGAVNQSR